MYDKPGNPADLPGRVTWEMTLKEWLQAKHGAYEDEIQGVWREWAKQKVLHRRSGADITGLDIYKKLRDKILTDIHMDEVERAVRRGDTVPKDVIESYRGESVYFLWAQRENDGTTD